MAGEAPVPPRAVPVPTLGPPAKRPWFRSGSVAKYVFLTVFAIAFVAPFFYLVTLSFQPLGDMFSYPPQWIPNPVRWDNYAEATHRAPLWIWLNNTAIITVLGWLLFSSPTLAMLLGRLVLRIWPNFTRS